MTSVHPPDTVRWPIDPTRHALALSTWRHKRFPGPFHLPEPFCLEVGRRILLAQLEFSQWMLRRVEKLEMAEDRSISRAVALEFSVRDDAPEFEGADGHISRLVPLTFMRRRTLVNLDVRDEEDRTVLMPGIRLTQQLDQAVMLAAAATVEPHLVNDPEVLQFVRLAICGERPVVAWAYAHFDSATSGPLARLHADSLFRFVAERFRFNFTFYMFVPDRMTRAGARLVRMSFTEPTDWRHQRPELSSAPNAPGELLYEVGQTDKVNWRRLLSTFGVRPIRVRFQVPGAETAASVHCEVAAPPGLRIVKATLLAGRPNDPSRHVSEDQVVGHTPMAGLHAVEVPNGSLCRVQVDLAVPTQGWLNTVWISTIAIFVVLLSVALHWKSTSALSHEQITNVVLILATTSAGVAALVAQRDGGAVAARFVAQLRLLGTIALILPLVAAGLLVYSGLKDGTGTTQRQVAKSLPYMTPLLWTLTGVAGGIAMVFGIVWLQGIRMQRVSIVKESPWDQTTRGDLDGPLPAEPPLPPKPNFGERCKALRFDSAAVGVESAEGWHSRYFWDDDKQVLAVDAVRLLGARPADRTPGTTPTTTAGGIRCPRSFAITTLAPEIDHANGSPRK